MSYRVEAAITGRAVCKGTACKKAGIKINKEELRFGVWVTIEEHSGWQWRHWGCMSGKQMQNVRNYLQDPEAPEGTYRWDFLDGYEGDEKGSLEKYPDLQAKVRKAIEQGFIDPEDFNGDPEMNKLGMTGLVSKETKQKNRDDEKKKKQDIAKLNADLETLTAERDNLAESGKSTKKLDVQIKVVQDILDVLSPPKKKSATSKKRANDASDGEEEDMPAKKKRVTKVKAEVGEEEDIKPAKKSRAKKVKKEDGETENDEEDVKPTPARKPRAKKVKKEENVEDGVKPAPAKKSRAKKGVKAEPEDEAMGGFDGVADDYPPKKARGKKVKAEAVKDEPVEEDNVISAPAKAAPKKGRKKGVKAEPSDDAEANLTAPDVKGGNDSDAQEEGSVDTRMATAGSSFKGEDEGNGEEKTVVLKKGGRRKNSAPASKPARGTRSRTTSKQIAA